MVAPKAETAKPNVVKAAGLCNLAAHVENMKKYGVPVVVAINHFLTDSDEEVEVLETTAVKTTLSLLSPMSLCKRRRRRHRACSP